MRHHHSIVTYLTHCSPPPATVRRRRWRTCLLASPRARSLPRWGLRRHRRCHRRRHRLVRFRLRPILASVTVKFSLVRSLVAVQPPGQTSPFLTAIRCRPKPSPPPGHPPLFQRHPRGHAPSPLHRQISHAPLTAARHCPPPPSFLPPTSRPRAGGLPTTTTTTCRCGRSPPLVGAHPRADVPAVACRRYCSCLRRLS